MMTESVVLSLYFETPLHAGASGTLGAVDLPIQRERTTQWPTIPAGDVRASLRKAMAGAGEDTLAKLFGDGDADASLSLGDARLLFFPVRSSVAPFVWITCPAALARLRRDLERTVGVQLPAVPAPANEEILVGAAWNHGSDAFALEDAVVTPKPGLELPSIAQLLPATSSAYEGFARELESSVGIVSDELFGFLVRTAVEISPVASSGAVAYQEMMPADALFYVPVAGLGAPAKGKKQSATQLLEKNLPSHVQFGADAQLGRGWARMHVLKAQGGTP